MHQEKLLSTQGSDTLLKMGRSSRNAERWRQAKKRNKAFQCTIEFYIPIPRNQRLISDEAKKKIVKKLNPPIEKLKQTIKSLDGITRVYQHV